MTHTPPEGVYPRGLTYRIAALILCAALLAGLFTFRARLGPAAFWGLSGAAVLVLLLYWWVEAGKFVQIHPEGVVLRGVSSSRLLRWESVREVRYRAIHSRGGAILGPLFHVLLRFLSRRARGVDERAVSIRCVLVSEGEPPLIITSGWSRAADAVEKILARVNPRLLQEALDRVRQSGRAEFGPVIVQHDSLIRGGKSIRFAEIGSWGLEKGKFFVKRQGAWLASIQVPVSKIPNIFVLAELLRHLGVAGLRQSDLSSATYKG